MPDAMHIIYVQYFFAQIFSYGQISLHSEFDSPNYSRRARSLYRKRERKFVITMAERKTNFTPLQRIIDSIYMIN